jgi:tetratricopeptide (TPR) repeat protein
LKKLSQKSPLAKQQETELALRIGGLYSAVGQHEAAQRWYRRVVELAPDRYEPLAVELARQDHMREAIELCQNAAQSDNSAQPALVLAAVLTLGKPTADDIQLAEATLSKTAANHKDSVDLLYAWANVRVVQQKIGEAVRLYQQVLTLKPTHVATLNNLATLLGEQPGKRQEALQYVERAIQIVGPQPGLLDTKGMILVFEGKADEAVPLLQEATARPRSDPRYHFHLAVAYDRSGDAGKAREALTTARKGELTRQVLTSLDQQMLAELEKKFGL